MLPCFLTNRDSSAKPCCEPRSFADQPILIVVVNTKMGPGILERHLHITRHRSRPLSDLCVGKLEAATRTCQRNVERLAIKLVDDRSAAAPHDARYIDPCGSEFQVRLELYRQEQGLAKFRACGREYGEVIAQWFACAARDNCFKYNALSFIRTFVDNDLAFAISLLDFARPLVQRRPIQPGERRIVEMAFNDPTDEGRLAIAVGAGYVELATTIHSAVAVVIGFALK
jgi:hypothetical protein